MPPTKRGNHVWRTTKKEFSFAICTPPHALILLISISIINLLYIFFISLELYHIYITDIDAVRNDLVLG